MTQKPMKGEHRTMEQLRDDYEIEKELADKLRNASKQERHFLYSSLYDEFYRRVPRTPQLIRKASPIETKRAVSSQISLLKPFLGKKATFLEVGPGDCALSIELTQFVKQVYAVDVSDEITRGSTQPTNFHLILSDGSSIPIPPNSVDVVYSNQLMEHLHPDDAFEQLKNIYAALVPGGIYICVTPNRLSGPHDISKYFDKAAMGFHLKEYTTFELIDVFRKAGFSRLRVCIGGKGKYISLPTFPIVLYEKVLDKLPYSFRKTIVGILPFRLLLGIRLVGVK
jgi:SAM-dependent methyltransferase